MHISNSDTRVPSIRNIDSQDQFAQRIDESAESERSEGASHALTDQSLAPEPERRPQGGEHKSRSKDLK